MNVSIGDIAEVFRMPTECEGIEGADANVGRRVKVIEEDLISFLLGEPSWLVEFIDGPGKTWVDLDTLHESQLRGICPDDCLRKVEFQ